MDKRPGNHPKSGLRERTFMVRMCIGRRLFLVYGLSLFFIAAIIFVGMSGMLRMKSASKNVYEEAVVEVQRLIELKADLEDVRRILLTMLVEPDGDRLRAYKESLDASTRAIDDNLGFMLSPDTGFDPEIRPVLTELRSVWEAFRETRDRELLPAVYGGERNGATRLAVGLQEERFQKFMQLVSVAVAHEKGEALMALASIEDGLDSAISYYAVITALGMLVAVGSLGHLSRVIAKRIRAIADAVERLESGDFNATADISGEDEIGTLAAAFNSMARRLHEDKTNIRRHITALEAAMREIGEKNRMLEGSIEEIRRANLELETTRAQMIQSEKMASVGQLAAGVAHEINNPLSFVGSNLRTLAQYSGDTVTLMELFFKMQRMLEAGDGKAAMAVNGEIVRFMEEKNLRFVIKDIEQLVDESNDGVERIKSIVAGLKEFSHKADERPVLCDLNQCVENIVRITWNEIKYRAVLDKELGELPAVECRPRQIEQVFLNIVLNAVQAIPDGAEGRIVVRTYARGGNVFVEVADNGAGMPEDVRGKIFDPFFTTKPVGKGTGLGLSIAYGIIKEHGGGITVDSRPGEGTTFIVRLPVVYGAGDAASQGRRPEPGSAS